jgi:hypothetical protein
MRPSISAEFHDWDARAAEALQEAHKLAPGSARNEAIQKANMLQQAADMKTFLSPPKDEQAGKS